jgi:hypothetical protein
MKKASLFLAGMVLLACSCLAQGFGNDCTPAGVWYGGSDASAKYILAITPGRAGHFNMTASQGFTSRLPHITPWVGELIKTAKGWEAVEIALTNNDTTPPPAGANPDLRAVRETVKFDGCDKLLVTINFYALYNWGSVPFADEPAAYLLGPGETEAEIYSRVPTTCKVCQSQ